MGTAYAMGGGGGGAQGGGDIQFFVMMTAVISVAYFAVRHVGGLPAMITAVSAKAGPGGLNYLSMLPDFKNHWDIALAVFIMPLAVQWWSVL